MNPRKRLLNNPSPMLAILSSMAGTRAKPASKPATPKPTATAVPAATPEARRRGQGACDPEAHGATGGGERAAKPRLARKVAFPKKDARLRPHTEFAARLPACRRQTLRGARSRLPPDKQGVSQGLSTTTARAPAGLYRYLQG